MGFLLDISMMFDELRKGEELKRDNEVRGEVTSHGGTCDWFGEAAIDTKGQGEMLDPRGHATRIQHA